MYYLSKEFYVLMFTLQIDVHNNDTALNRSTVVDKKNATLVVIPTHIIVEK